MTEAFLKEKLVKLYHQLCYGAEESIHGEPQAYLYLPNGKYIEVTYKEKEIRILYGRSAASNLFRSKDYMNWFLLLSISGQTTAYASRT